MNSRSSYWRAQSSALLMIAVALGTPLRFFRLGSHELSIDESLSWAESSRRNVARVLYVQHRLDSGKFPIYEIAQHGWMLLFGETEAAMRALPALIGSLSIVLVFILGVELMLAVSGTPEASGALSGRSPEPSPDLSRENNGRGTKDQSIYMVAGVCALLFAVGLPSVEIARQARMYSMMQGWVVAQLIFLLRARRLGGPANYAGVTIFSAIAVATNFTAGLVIAAEALWLIYLYFAHARSDAGERSATPWLMAGALVAAMLLLLPFYAGLRYGVEGVPRGDYAWIRPPGALEPFETFENGLGSWPFVLFALFAIFGGVRLWRAHRDEAVLLILLVAIPAIVLLAGSHLVTPMLVTRYLICSFIGVYILTSIGIESLPSRNYRAAAIVAIVVLSVLRVSADLRPGDHRWRDACEIALSRVGTDRRIGVCRGFYLVSYYIPPAQRDSVKIVRIPRDGIENNGPPVVIVSPNATPGQVAEIRREYPVVVSQVKNVTVVSRPEAGATTRLGG
jgi:hypothetical protein